MIIWRGRWVGCNTVLWRAVLVTQRFSRKFDHHFDPCEDSEPFNKSPGWSLLVVPGLTGAFF